MADVVFVDTSVLLNLLDVPGKNGDRDSVTAEFKRMASDGVVLVIPIAAVIEVGNHIAQLSSGRQRRDRAQRFAGFLSSSANNQAPWVVSGVSWDATFLRRLVDGHDPIPGLTDLCAQEVGSGDASILHERNRYRDRSDLPSGQPVRLWTLDNSLRAHAGT